MMLSTASYAWFTSNKNVTVSTLNVHVETQNGLQISADGSTWKTVLQNTDITTGYTGAKNQLPASMEPVSSAKKIDTTTGYLKMFYGTVGANGGGENILTATQTTEQNGTTGKFIAFDMFLKVEAATDLLMTTNSNVVTKEGTTSVGMEHAARVAFVNEGVASVSDSLDTIRALKGGTDATTYFWEPNYDVHTDAAVAHARDTYGITTQKTGATAIAYDGIMAEIADTANVLVGEANKTNHGTLFDTVTVDYKTIKGFATDQQVFSLPAGISKIRVYMWIEGQDVDCENNASGSDISYNLQLAAKTN